MKLNQLLEEKLMNQSHQRLRFLEKELTSLVLLNQIYRGWDKREEF